MATDTAGARAECTVPNDPRLIAGVAALASHVAQHAGCSERAQHDVDEAVLGACDEAFRAIGRKARARATIHVVLTTLPEGLEVNLEFPADKRAAESFASRRGGRRTKSGRRTGAPTVNSLVDRIERIAHEGRCRLTLVKYCGVAKSRAKA